MKKNIKIFAIILLTLCLFGCTSVSSSNDQGETIVTPNVTTKLDINGTWRITKYKVMRDTIGDESEAKALLKSNASFNSELAAVGRNYLASPKYKLRVVNLGAFLANEYRLVEDLGESNKEVEVTSVSDENNVFCDFIKLDANEGMLAYKGVLYTLNKTSDKTLNQWDVGVNIKSEDSIGNLNEYYNDPIGVLIGLKSSREKEPTGQYSPASYRTMWVYYKNNTLSETKEVKDLLVPRMKGFWTIKVNHTQKGGTVNEEIETSMIYGGATMSPSTRPMEYKHDLYRDISFVGNDYIATQYYRGDNFKGNYSGDQILPIDNTKLLKGIDIGTLLGEEAKKSFYTSWQQQVENLSSEAKEKLNSEKPNYENYTMIRSNGHWAFQGKISANDQDNFNGVSFKIDYPPTKKLVNHDKLFVSWNSIKEIEPSAVDAYSAYNGRLVFVVNKDKINIYEIKKDTIDPNVIGHIDLKNGESVVMCEWVVLTQDVERWDKVVSSVMDNKR